MVTAKTAARVLVLTERVVNGSDVGRQRSIRSILEDSVTTERVALGDVVAGRETVGAGNILAVEEDAVAVASLASLGDDGGELVEDLDVVGLDGAEAVGLDVDVVGCDDGVLGDVLDGVGAGVVVGNIRVLGKLREPLVGVGEGLVGVGAVEIEGVAGLVDDDGEEVGNVTEEGNGTVPLESPGTGV